MSLQPRLFADYAATPTRRERSAIRAHWKNLSPSLFELDNQRLELLADCPVCGSLQHRADECPHGTAPTLL